MTTPQHPQDDPWQHTPGMTPEQQPPPPPPGYGQAPYGGQYGGQPPPRKAGNGLGIAALVLGILGILSSFLVVGGVLGVLAIVLAVLALRRAGANKAMPIIGLLLGIGAILVAVLVVAVIGDEFGNLAECMADARTPAEERACEQQFQDAVEQ